MDPRTDTSSGRFAGQWAFLSNPPHHDQSRSLPPSSTYIRSDRSSVLPLPTGLHLQHLNASRSSLPRNIYTPSAGGHTSATVPSQPVLIRVHSADASAHLHPAPRPPRRRPIMSKNNELPPIADFSIQGILAAIEEDIEGDINAISEILGRSRLVLADQHDSHLPPQGEIRAGAAAANVLGAVEEASSSSERLAADDVLILAEDASLAGGSHTGSAAYGLLERLQAVPRTRRMRSDMPSAPVVPRARMPDRVNSSPAVLTEAASTPLDLSIETSPLSRRRVSRNLLQSETSTSQSFTAESHPRTTNAVVSETYLSAGSNGRIFSDPPVVSEAGRHYPLYSYNDSELFNPTPNLATSSGSLSFRERMQRLLFLHDLQRFMRSIGREPPNSTPESSRGAADVGTGESGAEIRLRRTLERQQHRQSLMVGSDENSQGLNGVEDPELYE